jgi:hypothetical protein
LLLHDGSPLAEALAQALSALGQVVSQAELGPEYQKAGRGRYRLRPGNAEDRRALVADLRAMLRVPQHVISCWSSGGVLEPAIQGLYATAALASELAAIPQTEGKVRVSMITAAALTWPSAKIGPAPKVERWRSWPEPSPWRSRVFSSSSSTSTKANPSGWVVG